LFINLTDNTTVSTSFNNIQKITFNTEEMLIITNNGEIGYLLDDIASITFLEKTGIENFTEEIDVNIFINAFGEIVVESSFQINQLTVFDLTGKQVATCLQNKLNVNFLNTGVYILQVATDKRLVTQKFTKNR
jgi:hypothetical protein